MLYLETPLGVGLSFSTEVSSMVMGDKIKLGTIFVFLQRLLQFSPIQTFRTWKFVLHLFNNLTQPDVHKVLKKVNETKESFKRAFHLMD
ncbi:hypothetical protein AQUCO_02300187v1 [Aquilegia coerulea]|uniref:Uncharacterized protein n=1 Tax=Aquilegia coerulea TaxID=218851 RepID=A0A2G5DCF4_AQUCA|nr:hypothetical protein AQUCO_02300187v1 [Aquilegia coerulea]